MSDPKKTYKYFLIKKFKDFLLELYDPDSTFKLFEWRQFIVGYPISYDENKSLAQAIEDNPRIVDVAFYDLLSHDIIRKVGVTDRYFIPKEVGEYLSELDSG